jgi:hypothetical protein
LAVLRGEAAAPHQNSGHESERGRVRATGGSGQRTRLDPERVVPGNSAGERERPGGQIRSGRLAPRPSMCLSMCRMAPTPRRSPLRQAPPILPSLLRPIRSRSNLRSTQPLPMHTAGVTIFSGDGWIAEAMNDAISQNTRRDDLPQARFRDQSLCPVQQTASSHTRSCAERHSAFVVFLAKAERWPALSGRDFLWR